MSKKQIKIMDTSFRDGFQSVYGARVFTKDFLPALRAAKEAGLKHFEVGGGARFQAPIFYCNENAFDMMDTIRKEVGPDIELQTLARGVNVVGLESQPRDIINLHAKLFKKHGMTTIRNFDALNDVDNLIYSGQCIKNNGLKHEVTITMMDLPIGCKGAHDAAFYKKILENILEAEIPFDTLCFKDASGTSHPRKVYETVKMAREILGKKAVIRFHSHETAGTGLASYLSALEGGANAIDLAMKPVSGGTSQPDIVSMWHALRDTEYVLGIDIEKIMIAEEIFKDCMKDYFLPPEAADVNPMIIQSPLPGGALTANTQMMRDNGTMDRFPEVVKAMKEVVEKGGFATSVTPVSQFYFQQAYSNVMLGPWKKITEGYGKMALGYFGKTPCAPDPEVVKLAQEQLNLEPTSEKVIDLNDKDETKGIKAATATLQKAGLETTEENIFIAAACKEKGIDFLLGKGKIGVRKKDKNKANTSGEPLKTDKYAVTVNGKTYTVKLEGEKAVINGKTYEVSVKAEESQTTQNQAKEEKSISAKLSGSLKQILVKEGDHIKENETVAIIEAMKMDMEIPSPFEGTIASIKAAVGDQITSGQVLMTIR